MVDDSVAPIWRTFKFRLRPNKAQTLALDAMLRDCCTLYNACLEQRIDAYRRRGVSIRYSGQSNELKDVREAFPSMARWGFTTLQQVMRRVEKTYSSFYRRGHGFPRFRSINRYDSVDMRVGDGLTIRKTRKLGVIGIPGYIKVVWHRDLPEMARFGQSVIVRKSGKWFVFFRLATIEEPKQHTGPKVGIDLGLESLIATSFGETIPTPQFERKASRALRLHQRALTRCKRGSKRRQKAKSRVAAVAAKTANQRRDFAHKLSRSLVDRYCLIAFEKLNVAGLKRGPLAKSIHNAAWSQLVQFVTYKAASAGGVVALVDPRGTSQTCPECGTIGIKRLSERMHRCECGCVMNRDVAAAKIVLQRALLGPGTGLQAPSKRVAA